MTLPAPPSALAVALAAALLAPAAAAAQARPTPPARPDSLAADSLSADSLAARLARAEAAIALLREQLATEAEMAVRTQGRMRLELTGRVLTNAFVTRGRPNVHDVPLLALPPADSVATAVGRGALGATVRQTRLGAALLVRDVLGAEFVGDVDVDFFGGSSAGPGDRRLFPEPRLRVARAHLRWARTALMVGSETPLVSDLNPMSLAAVGIPGFVAAGNLWNWIPQVRLSRELGALGSGLRAVRWALHGALLDPYANVQPLGEGDAADAGNRSRRPALEARLAARTADAEGAGETELAPGAEIGVGVHRGWVRATGARLESSHAVTADWRIALGTAAELRGEAYVGRLLRGLGGGAIGQSFGRAAPGEALGPALRDRAAWTQLNVRPHVTLVAGAGCGVNRVEPDDRPVRRENVACAGHVLWRPTQPLVLGVEYRDVRTRYDAGRERVRHLNLALGFEL